MNIVALIISTVAGLSTILGYLFIYIKPKNNTNFIGAALAFSATIMILLSVTELIPSGFINLEYRFNLWIAFLGLISMIFIGNFISRRIKKQIDKKKQINTSLYRVGVLSMVALMIHNLPEGVLIYLTTQIDLELGIKLGIAIMMHNIPEGIAIAIPIYYATKSKKKAFKMTLISGLSEPIGAILAWLLLSHFITATFISIIMLFVAGLMISISINDIFEEAKKSPRKYLYYGIILAFSIFIINLIIF